MNKNFERCTRCSRRKTLIATGYLRRWLKPVECKHMQRNRDSQNDYDSVKLSDCSQPNNTNKFVKFWKAKVFVGSLRSLQRYFTKSADDCVHNCDRASAPSSSEYKKDLERCDTVKSGSNMKRRVCQHSDGHYVLRGHTRHSSHEPCDLYCELSKQGWYWGGISRREAEDLLCGQPDNVFLVRDSYNSRHLLSVSFRCVGRTLHTRLRHAKGLFSLNNEDFVPVNRISEHCLLPTFASFNIASELFDTPVKLARPLNRFAKLDSLQMICRFVIRQSVAQDKFEELPLPTNLISYVSQGSDYIVPE